MYIGGFMKLIISKLHDSKFEESDLNYKNETKKIKSDRDYLLFRNAISSYRFYTIVEIDQDDQNQIISLKSPILSIDQWDKTVFDLGEYFISRFSHKPQIITANQNTLNKIDLVMNNKLKAQGLESEWKTLDTFACALFEARVCIDDELGDDYICIIYDEQAEF
jgi:hypothetical protein